MYTFSDQEFIAIGVAAAVIIQVIGLVLLVRHKRFMKRHAAQVTAQPQAPAPGTRVTPAAPAAARVKGEVPAGHILTEEDIKAIRQAAIDNYLKLLEESNGLFKDDLAKTSEKLGEQVTRLTTLVIEREMGRYHEVVQEVTAAATSTMSRVQEVVEQLRSELESKLVEEVKTEKQRLLDKFDDNIADVLSAYLVEALGQGVDLGAQTQFIVRMLDEHKAELKREIMDEL